MMKGFWDPITLIIELDFHLQVHCCRFYIRVNKKINHCHNKRHPHRGLILRMKCFLIYLASRICSHVDALLSQRVRKSFRIVVIVKLHLQLNYHPMHIFYKHITIAFLFVGQMHVVWQYLKKLNHVQWTSRAWFVFIMNLCR